MNEMNILNNIVIIWNFSECNGRKGRRFPYYVYEYVVVCCTVESTQNFYDRGRGAVVNEFTPYTPYSGVGKYLQFQK